MKKTLLIRFFVLGIIGAVVLSGLSMLSLNHISELGAQEHRQNFLLFLASSVESEPLNQESLEFMKRFEPRPPFGKPGWEGKPRNAEPGFGRPPFPPPPPFPPRGGPGGPRGPGRPSLWLVNEQGGVISTTVERSLPVSWNELLKPASVHEISSREDWLKVTPGLFIVKLATKEAHFLVLQEERRSLNGPFFITQLVLVFTTVCIALFLALSITFFYLQRKSKEAKAVLLRLEKGDLKARFEIKSFDEFGNLLLDFNRMAEQIEKLVVRVQETEKTRRNLLQELGHDLRTPLTGLNTSFETLKFHWPKMSEPQRTELFGIMGGEIEYLGDLLDKLMVISSLDEPHYRPDSDVLDLAELISQEVSSRERSRHKETGPHWEFRNTVTEQSHQFLGDPHLILRMIRNALDNAAKFANQKVFVSLSESEKAMKITVEDDGAGFSEIALQSFGHRLEHRVRRDQGENHFSLGLGSVIMKTIAELHGGSVAISNHSSLNKNAARVEITLPKTV
jgi:signal transduction histidine kinase